MTPMLQVSMFFVSWLATFFDRTWPASSIAKPACMKKMRKVTVNTHSRLTPSTSVLRSTPDWSTPIMNYPPQTPTARPDSESILQRSCCISRPSLRRHYYINVRVNNVHLLSHIQTNVRYIVE